MCTPPILAVLYSKSAPRVGGQNVVITDYRETNGKRSYQPEMFNINHKKTANKNLKQFEEIH